MINSYINSIHISIQQDCIQLLTNSIQNCQSKICIKAKIVAITPHIVF